MKNKRTVRRWPFCVGAAVAVLAVVLLITGLPWGGGTNGSVKALRAYAISEPEYPDYPQRVDGKQVERDGFYAEYRDYREELLSMDDGLTEAAANFSQASSQMILSGEGENIVYSPVSFWIALSMLAETTDGDTRQQILNTLGVENPEELRQQTKAMWQHIYKDDDVAATRLGSSIWVNSNFPVRKEPLDALAEHYYAGSYAVEMGTEKANKAIARWVDSMTEGLLSDQTAQIQTTGDVIMQLYSTLYYNAKWHGFLEQNTHEDTFTKADGTEVQRAFMHKSENGGLAMGGDTFIAGRLSTTNTGIYFVLPDEGKTADDVLADPSLWSGLWDNEQWQRREIKWRLPKFDISSDIDLLGAMEEMGITDVMVPGMANYDPLIDRSYLPYLSQAQQVARVQTDEEGVRAVAYTVLGGKTGAALPPEYELLVLDFNRPFIMIIDSGVDEVPLFVGVINDPAAP